MKAQKVGTTMEGGEVEGIKYQLTEENPTFFFYKRKNLPENQQQAPNTTSSSSSSIRSDVEQ